MLQLFSSIFEHAAVVSMSRQMDQLVEKWDRGRPNVFAR
jgi:hypothetical protein